MQGNNIIRALKALSDENRYRMIEYLSKGDLCVGALARLLNTSKPAVSQHLKVLREAGLVRGEKRGYWTHYLVDKEMLRKVAVIIEELTEDSEQSNQNELVMCPRQYGRSAQATQGLESDLERRVMQMCEKCCEQPDKLKMKPEDCTPEQKKECHGDREDHPCECGDDKQK